MSAVKLTATRGSRRTKNIKEVIGVQNFLKEFELRVVDLCEDNIIAKRYGECMEDGLDEKMQRNT